MELNRIETLLQKYEEGETSLVEEKELRSFFSRKDIPEHMKSYQLMFAFAASQRKETFSKEHNIKSPQKPWVVWSSIAAILIVALGLFYYNNSTTLNENDLGTINDKELALQKTKETLAMVSQFLNDGTADLVYLKEFNTTANKIIEID